MTASNGDGLRQSPYQSPYNELSSRELIRTSDDPYSGDESDEDDFRCCNDDYNRIDCIDCCCVGSSEEDEETKLWDVQIKDSAQELKYFMDKGRLEHGELDKESLFTASIVLPMVAWSSGRQWNPFCCRCSPDMAELHVASWLMRTLLFGCLWLQWWLLDALHAARVKFPALDGVPFLCTYGQDTGETGQAPRGPLGYDYERNRGNIEPDYHNVMMRNGLAKVLEALNMTNTEIGPVDYGMESATCRFLCVTILCMWVLKTLFSEATVLNFLWSVPKLVIDKTGKYAEHWHIMKHCCCRPCLKAHLCSSREEEGEERGERGEEREGSTHREKYNICCQSLHAMIPPIIFVLFFWRVLESMRISIFRNFDEMHVAMLRLLAIWVPVTVLMNVFFSIQAPHERYSWIHREQETEDFMRSWENAVINLHQKALRRVVDQSNQHLVTLSDDDWQALLRSNDWHVLRANMKKDMRSLLGTKDFEKVKFEPKSLPYHFFWCEVMPFFTLRLFVVLMVARQGVFILLNTGSIMDLILNSLAITFVLELEKLLYFISSGKHIRNVMANLQPFAKSNIHDVFLSMCPDRNDSFRDPYCNTSRQWWKRCLSSLGLRPLYYRRDPVSPLRRIARYRQHDMLKRRHGIVEGQALLQKYEGVELWTIDNLTVKYETNEVTCTLTARYHRRIQEQITEQIEDFDNQFKLVRRHNRHHKNVEEDAEREDKSEHSEEEHNDGWPEKCRNCCRFCCKSVVPCWDATYPLLLFFFVVWVAHVCYLYSFCVTITWPVPFAWIKDINKPYFTGDNRLLGGWMALVGNWISKNVTINKSTTCYPYLPAAIGERNASGCAMTPDPTSVTLPWR